MNGVQTLVDIWKGNELQNLRAHRRAQVSGHLDCSPVPRGHICLAPDPQKVDIIVMMC